MRKSKKFTEDNASSSKSDVSEVVAYKFTTASLGARKRRAQTGVAGGIGGDDGRSTSGIQLYLVNKRLCDEHTSRRSTMGQRLSSNTQHSTRQSWVALNKSLVYGMIDSALAAQCTVKQRKQQRQHQKQLSHERLQQQRSRRTSRGRNQESTQENCFTYTSREHERIPDCTTEHTSCREERGKHPNIDSNNLTENEGQLSARDTKDGDTVTEGSVSRELSGLSVSVSSEMDTTPVDTISNIRVDDGSKRSLKPDMAANEPSVSILTSIKKSNSSLLRSRRKTCFESQESVKHLGRNNNNNNNIGDDVISNVVEIRPISGSQKNDNCNRLDPYFGLRDLMLVNNATDDIVDYPRHIVDSHRDLENEPHLQGNRSRGAQRAYKRSPSLNSVERGDVRRTLGGNEGVGPTPRWMALDKSEVCSLVESLVSTMMMLDDPDLHPTQAMIRSIASDEPGTPQPFSQSQSSPTSQAVSPYSPTITETVNNSASDDSSINNITLGDSPMNYSKSDDVESHETISESETEMNPFKNSNEGNSGDILPLDPSELGECALGGGPQGECALGGGPQGESALGGGPQSESALGGGPQGESALGGGPQGMEKVSAGQRRNETIKWKSSMLLRLRSEHVMKVTTAKSSQSH